MGNSAVNIEMEGSEWYLDMKLEEKRKFSCCCSFGNNSYINYILYFEYSARYYKKAIPECVM